MSADFDKAIDRAVREMLDVEPASGLRQRVIERLPASSFQPRAAGFRLPASAWIFGTVAAAAVLMLVILLPRSTPPKPDATTAQVRQPAPPATATPPALEPRVAQARPETFAPGRGAVVEGRRAPQAIAAAAYAPAAAPGDDIEPLQSLAPIQVAPVAPRAITQAVIAIPALNPIADLEIAPLNPPERRN